MQLSSLDGKYPAIMLQRAWSWSRAQREKGRPEVGPGVVLLRDSFEYLPTARHPGGRAKDISLGFFWIVPAAQAENKTKREINWAAIVVESDSFEYLFPRSRPSARSNIFSLIDSLHYCSDPELLFEPHTACHLTFPILLSQLWAQRRKWAQSLFPSVDISMQGGTATITQSISFPWTIALSPSNYYQAPTSDPLIATRPISYTQLAAACMPNLRLKGMLPPTKHVFRKKYWLLQEK